MPDPVTSRFTIREIAARFRSSTRRVLALIEGGHLRALNVGSGAQRPRWVIDLADVEKQLAEGPSCQIPLNPDVRATLPDAIKDGRTAHPMAVDFEKAADLWDEVQTFLRDEFAR